MKNKKVLWITLISLDVAITIFLFVMHIIMLANVVNKSAEQIAQLTGLIGFLASKEKGGTIVYLCVRIHPFEDGNGRIARLLVNYILSRHGFPMIVVRSRKKSEYLEALHAADIQVGSSPSKGANASLKEIRPFVQYFKGLVTQEIYSDVCFLTEHDENLWWYDGERIVFRTPNYNKVLTLMQSEPALTIAEIQKQTGINMSATKKLINQLLEKHYIEKGQTDGSWRVFITPSI